METDRESMIRHSWFKKHSYGWWILFYLFFLILSQFWMRTTHANFLSPDSMLSGQIKFECLNVVPALNDSIIVEASHLLTVSPVLSCSKLIRAKKANKCIFRYEYRQLQKANKCNDFLKI